MSTLYSRITDQGTAMSEATLCSEHLNGSMRDSLDALASSVPDAGSDRAWHETTRNEAVECVVCGAGGTDRPGKEPK